ncbi:MAG: dienelactone hydrolase family protein [Clostridiales bacterium]|nr:dienelactone hydrolase family protein [Clostridiales bacterium]
MKKAILILHEIYGINPFIKEVCQQYLENGFDVFCPNLIKHQSFSYNQSEEAYRHFISNIGFDVYLDIEKTIQHLKAKYDKVFVLGFSIGATIAWRCSVNSMCDGIIGCYGSRIRDYTDLNPNCPTLLLFAKETPFDVKSLSDRLKTKNLVETYEFSANHGFLDHHSQFYNIQASENAKRLISDFITQQINTNC